MSTKQFAPSPSDAFKHDSSRIFTRVALALLSVATALSAAVAQPVVGDCEVFPRDNIWNTRIDICR
jgi:hypothetical protein